MSKWIKSGEEVMVKVGKYKGKMGKILLREGDKVLVSGVNLKKKFVKKSEMYPNGGILDVEAPIHISNVKLCVNGEEVKKLRVRYNDKNEKELYYIKNGVPEFYRLVKK